MSQISSSYVLLKQTRRLIEQHQLGNIAGLNLPSIQEGLEKSDQKISSLRKIYLKDPQDKTHINLMEETAYLVDRIGKILFTIETIKDRQSIQDVSEVHKVYAQLKDFYEKDLSELEQTAKKAAQITTWLNSPQIVEERQCYNIKEDDFLQTNNHSRISFVDSYKMQQKIVVESEKRQFLKKLLSWQQEISPEKDPLLNTVSEQIKANDPLKDIEEALLSGLSLIEKKVPSQTEQLRFGFCYEALTELKDSQYKNKAIAIYYSLAARLLHQEELQTDEQQQKLKKILNKASHLEGERILRLKQNFLQLQFEKLLETNLKLPSLSNPSCFIVHDESPETRNWIEQILLGSMQAASITPIYDRISFHPGEDISTYSKKVKESDWSLVLCTPKLKQQYRAYQENKPEESIVGITMQWLQDRYLRRLQLDRTIHVLLKGNWSEVAVDLLIEGKLPENCKEESSEIFPQKNIYMSLIRTLGYIAKGDICYPLQKDFEQLALDILCRQLTQEELDISKSLSEDDETWINSRLQSISFLKKPVHELKELVRKCDYLCHIPRIRNKWYRSYEKFINRSSLQQLQDAVELVGKDSKNSIVTRALVGAPGTGKTELAIAFSENYFNKKIFSLIFWIDCSSEKTCEEGYLKLAKKLGIFSESSSYLDNLEGIFNALAATSDKWCIIFDNLLFDNLSLPCIGTGYILITTAHSEFIELDSKSIIELSEFSHEETIELTRKIIKNDSKVAENLEDLEEKICRVTRRFPLFVDQFAHFLTEKRTGFTKGWIKRFGSISSFYQKVAKPKRYPGDLQSIWKNSLEACLQNEDAKFVYRWLIFHVHLRLDTLVPILWLEKWLTKEGVDEDRLPFETEDIIRVLEEHFIINKYSDSEKCLSFYNEVIYSILQKTVNEKSNSVFKSKIVNFLIEIGQEITTHEIYEIWQSHILNIQKVFESELDIGLDNLEALHNEIRCNFNA